MITTARTRAGASIPTASMADVAFLLLMFFLVTTVFEEERGLPIVLPEATDQPVPASNLLHVHVLGQGLLEVQRGTGPALRVPPSQISALWREQAAHNPDLIAAVKTHPAAPYGDMVDVLDELHQAGAQRVSLQLLHR